MRRRCVADSPANDKVPHPDNSKALADCKRNGNWKPLYVKANQQRPVVSSQKYLTMTLYRAKSRAHCQVRELKGYLTATTNTVGTASEMPSLVFSREYFAAYRCIVVSLYRCIFAFRVTFPSPVGLFQLCCSRNRLLDHSLSMWGLPLT